MPSLNGYVQHILLRIRRWLLNMLLCRKWLIVFCLHNLCITLLDLLNMLFSSSQHRHCYNVPLFIFLESDRSIEGCVLKRVSFNQVMVKRQRTAFPPNFVHSLDGSHMMMTALACRRQGLYFAGWYFTICWSICGILACLCTYY
jgi:hypothetical protein